MTSTKARRGVASEDRSPEGPFFARETPMGLDDTRPEVHAVQIRIYRQMSAATKFAMITQGWNTLQELAMTGIRRRHPDCTADEATEQLAELMLGKPLASRMLAWKRARRA